MVSDQNDYNKGGFVAFVGSMVFTIGFFIYISLVHKGIDLKEVAPAQPTVPVTTGAASDKGSPSQAGEKPADPAAGQAFDAGSVKEPWIESPELVSHGRNIFAQNCAMCHGAEGKGDGVAGANLNPKPRNLVEGKWTQGGDSIALFNVVTKGIAGTSMAPFGHLPVADRWALVHFIRSITKNKVADNDAKLKADAPNLK